MFKNYDEKIGKILLSDKTDTNWKTVYEEHNFMLQTIRHERMIHLLVTIFVGMIMSMSFFVTIISEKSYTLFLGIPLLVLFIGYIFHYRFLENTAERWSELVLEIKKRL